MSAAVAVRMSGVVEGAAEGVDGVSLEAESDVGVDSELFPTCPTVGVVEVTDA